LALFRGRNSLLDTAKIRKIKAFR
jgi:hypothetical protein